MRSYWVYILANRNAVLYVGVTNDLIRRVLEHRAGKYAGFTHRYNVHQLVYFETYSKAGDACARERQIKGMRRVKKVRLIERGNAGWLDLFESLTAKDGGSRSSWG
jgi:putative endonuclease